MSKKVSEDFAKGVKTLTRTQSIENGEKKTQNVEKTSTQVENYRKNVEKLSEKTQNIEKMSTQVANYRFVVRQTRTMKN
jgi:DNA repair exonuclease SbcCD ATPase subunit